MEAPCQGLVDGCVHSLPRSQQAVTFLRSLCPQGCFLEEGSCGQKWLFPAGSRMLELTQGSEKACGKGLYLFIRLI